MENFKFVGLSDVQDSQVDLIAELLCETGYYEYVSSNNKLNLPTIQFQKVQTLKPYEKYTHILINTIDNSISGFFIAATVKQIQDVERTTPNWHKEDSEVDNLLHQLVHFYCYEALPTDLVLYSTAMHPLWRGKLKYKQLFNQQQKLAKNNNCSRIILVVWESNPAIEIYKHYGAKILGKIDFTNTPIKDTLIKCYIDLK